MEYEPETDRTKKSPMKISCFNNRRSVSSSAASPNLKNSPSSWFKLKLMCHETFRETQCIRSGAGREHRRNRSSGRCMMSRMGRHRRHSAEFSYDPLSYALNFQEEDEPVEEMKFALRLPVSPPTAKNLEDLNGRMEAVEIGTKRNDRPTAREKTADRLRDMFEVWVPRVKREAARVTIAEPSVEASLRRRRWGHVQKGSSWRRHVDNRWIFQFSSFVNHIYSFYHDNTRKSRYA